jgi:hypothetical protein
MDIARGSRSRALCKRTELRAAVYTLFPHPLDRHLHTRSSEFIFRSLLHFLTLRSLYFTLDTHRCCLLFELMRYIPSLCYRLDFAFHIILLHFLMSFEAHHRPCTLCYAFALKLASPRSRLQNLTPLLLLEQAHSPS